jgi:uncharacterized protein YjiK
MACYRGQESTVNLEQYSLTLWHKPIEGVIANASGLTYSRKTKSLFLAVDQPPKIVELSLKGRVKRQMLLSGFDDTEGITWIEGDSFAVVEEARGNLVLIEITADTKSIDYAKATKFSVDSIPMGNLGLEGLTYDPAGKRFFAVKQMEPIRIYEIRLPAKKFDKAEVTSPFNIEEVGLGLRDLSGVLYDTRTGHLLLLSHEPKCVAECTLDGMEVSRLYLEEGIAGLDHRPSKPEGITIDKKGNLYLCSEPSAFYGFSIKRSRRL